MKNSKFFLTVLTVIALGLMVFTQPLSTKAAEIDIDAEAAILVDFETGKILYGKNIDEALDPASMTKMMTEYLILEAINSGEISWEMTTWISDYAYEISKYNTSSGVGLQQSKDFQLRELYKAMAINSDNAATIALAELEQLAGSEGEFVKMMNQKAEEMGLPDAHFVNSTGLTNDYLGENYPEGTDPDGVNQMSARSTALLAYRLLSDQSEVLDFSSVPETEFYGQTIRNWNWMLPHEGANLGQFYYEGIDGLKTGNTGGERGYMFTGTAEREGKRLISVVMGAQSESQRFEQTADLMDYGFDHFQTVELFAEGYQLEDESTLPVAKGKEDSVDISISNSISLPIKNGEEELYSINYHIDEDKLNEDGELVAPIEQGTKIGTAELVYTGGEDFGYLEEQASDTVDLVTNETVEKSNWFMLALGAVGNFFSGIFSSIVDTVKGWF